MEKLKELWAKLDLKTAMVGGAIVVTTSLGTCHFTGSSEESVESTPAAAPEAPAPVEDPKPEEAAEETEA